MTAQGIALPATLEASNAALSAAMEVNAHLNDRVEALTTELETAGRERSALEGHIRALCRRLKEARTVAGQAGEGAGPGGPAPAEGGVGAEEAAATGHGAGGEDGAAGADAGGGEAGGEGATAAAGSRDPSPTGSTEDWAVLPREATPGLPGTVYGSSVDWDTLRHAAAAGGWLADPEDVLLGPALGSGAFGSTFAGTWRGGRVAVKCVRLGGGEAATVFAREAGALSGVRHPNVMGLFGATIDPPARAWLLCERLDGGTLADWLHGPRPDRAAARQRAREVEEGEASGGDGDGDAAAASSSTGAPSAGASPADPPGPAGPAPGGARSSSLLAQFGAHARSLSASAAAAAAAGAAPALHLPRRESRAARLRMALDVARGMQALEQHDPPILHRDLKPSNVFLDEAGRAKVADLGLARALTPESYGDLTGETGTYAYMSPENVRHEPYSTSSDVWSWGVLAVECLARERPYARLYATPVQIAIEVSRGNLRPTIPSDVPPELAATLASCFDADPDARPSFGIIVAQLGRIVAGLERQERHAASQARWWDPTGVVARLGGGST